MSRLLSALLDFGDLLLDVLWRRRNTRAFVFIAVIFGLALATILVPNIDIGTFQRGGEESLGLKLGLDLQGDR